MNVLGIAGRRRSAAVALAVDGVIVAAAEEACLRVPDAGYALAGGFPAGAIDACLARVGMAMGDLQQISIVDETSASALWEPSSRLTDGDPWTARMAAVSRQRVNPLEADARLCAVASDTTDALVFSVDPAALAVYRRCADGMRLRVLPNGADRLVDVARTLARAIGASGANPFAAIDSLSVHGDPEFAVEMAEILKWDAATGLFVDQQAFDLLIARALEALTPDDGMSPVHIKAQQRRSALAASFIERLATVIHDTARDTCRGDRISLGGALFVGSRLNTRLKYLLGDRVTIAPVPESVGRAIGAAADGRESSGVAGLALGPTYSETDIKATLDNCRLDYVYEPDWSRLLTRISKMLSRGMVIAWFQGPMVFGPRSLGTRSVLCDPSTRYARENVNEYLKRRPLDEPLPVSFVPACADECLSTPIRSPFMLLDAAVKSPYRDRVRAALDHRYELRIHTISTEQAPELMELLQVHFDRCGVPGLINTTLSGPGEPIACTPRDAVRTVYSSAIDALVIGRFLLMKDYWLLRSDAN